MDSVLLGTYAVKNRDENIRSHSRSGGFFSAASDYVINNQGVVYGCILDDSYNAYHQRAKDIETRNKMRGSKYIQSKLGDSFLRIKEDLESGLLVLFTGTSCQVSGLRNFLGNYYHNLICIDIVCHGTPSPLVWQKYLKWQEKEFNESIISVDFRNKRDFGWKAHIETLYLKNGQAINSQVFKNLFYAHYILRPSCYECPYKSIYHPGDITIADYWGIDKAAPGFNDDKGVSLVLINTEKGQTLFDTVRDKLLYVNTCIEDSLQPPLLAPFPRPINRDTFWRDFKKRDFGYIARKYADYGKLNSIKHLCGRVLRKV